MLNTDDMTIDEAIAHAREVLSRKFDDRIHCIRCSEFHEQIAEWLEELKAYRKNSNGYNKEDIELNRKAMYNKAIDDCLLVINANRTKFIADICYSDLYDSIVQLKERRENES